MTMKLYQFAISHFSEKVRWALDYKNLNYQPVFLLPGTHSKQIRRMAPGSSVPVLDHDGEIVQGSAEILDYLERHFPEKSLSGDDANSKADALAWQQRLDDEAGPAIRTWAYHYLLQRPKQVAPMLTAQTPVYNRYLLRLGFSRVDEVMRDWMKINQKTADKAQQTLDSLLEELDAAYQTSGYLVGGGFTLADLTAASLLAPLFMPEKYPVPWPDTRRLPAPMKDWIAQKQPKLARVAEIYRLHR
ncbi:glutathione S-transferase family protein [Marinobacter sp.]|jgi:glutathione S-transferase|uniref:glutathione S-transferase family protein n=1 Tax=Marinobacter sp. TaxID=50741 RepID=UPI001984A093|nr:glutathione S-transferase family protein [Marinobacter sp.]MBC7191297.1 glutathione S-transferase family protein [Marinobacter sp.]